MGRYTGSPDTLVLDQRIDLRGFSAGSFCWPEYSAAIVEDPECGDEWQAWGNCLSAATDFTLPVAHTLHLLHYEADQLCVWKPGQHPLDQLQIRYTYVSTEGAAYKEHFGAREHNYSHWLTLNHATGWWDLARFLFVHSEAACSAKRDATPLRLLSWLSCRLEPAVDELIEATMLHLSTVEDSDLLALGTAHLEMETPLEAAEALRDHLIELISVRNLRRCLLCSANSCRGSRCVGYATSWTLCCRNSLQSVPYGLMLLGLYGPATTFVPPHMRMDIRFNQTLPLHFSSRHMTTSSTCGFFGAPCRSSCFRIHEWCIRWMSIGFKAKLYIDCINSTSN